MLHAILALAALSVGTRISYCLVHNHSRRKRTREAFTDLPVDVMHEIALYLSVRDLLCLKMASKSWASALTNRSIWFQVLRDILDITPISCLRAKLPHMSIEEIVRACVVLYRFNQTLYHHEGTIPVSAILDYQVDHHVGLFGFIPGGDYFVTSGSTSKSLWIIPVGDPQSKHLLYTTEGTNALPLLLATQCISPHLYRMVLYVRVGPPNRANPSKMLLIEYDTNTWTYRILESGELKYLERAESTYLSDRYWAYLTYQIEGIDVTRIMDLTTGTDIYLHLELGRGQDKESTIMIEGNFLIYASKRGVWVFNLPSMSSSSTELQRISPVWLRTDYYNSDAFAPPVLCSQPSMDPLPAFAAWRGEQMLVLQPDESQDSGLATIEDVTIMKHASQLIPGISSNLHSSAGVVVAEQRPGIRCGIYRIAYHDSLSPGMMRLDQDESTSEFLCREDVDTSWFPKGWMMYEAKLFFDEASARFMIAERPYSHILIFSLVP